MSLNFPDEPSDGDIFQGYIYDATRGVWDVKLIADQNLEDLDNVNVVAPVDGQALIYDAANTEWISGDVASGPAPTKIVASDSIDVDFSDGIELEKRAVAGDVTFTGSNYTSGVKKTIYLEGDTVQRSLTFPNEWTFLTDRPTAIGADRKNILDLNSFGTSASTTVGIWLGEGAFQPIVATGGTVTEILIAGVTYKVHTFTATDTFIVSDAGENSEVEYLVVAGGGGSGAKLQGQNGTANTGGGAGGGGAHAAGGSGGGAGAGGYRSSVAGENSGGLSVAESKLVVIPTTYIVTIGAGGANSGSEGNTGTQGSNSQFADIVSVGGGRGAGATQPGGSGGSGGGADGNSQAGGTASNGQGFAGGISGNYTGPLYPGGGGGGAGAPGGAGSGGSTPGNGGIGIPSNITGNLIYRAGGGGAGDGGAGGNGGGGAGGPSLGQSQGGSGIVIIRYPITSPN